MQQKLITSDNILDRCNLFVDQDDGQGVRLVSGQQSGFARREIRRLPEANERTPHPVEDFPVKPACFEEFAMKNQVYVWSSLSLTAPKFHAGRTELSTDI